MEEEILPVKVGDRDALFAKIERVQAGVRVLLETIEHSQVVLIAIRRVVAEGANAEVGVVEDEAAKVAVERLRSDADGDEIVVRRQISELPFVEELLHREVAVGARRPAANVRLDQPVLAQMDVIEIADDRRFPSLRDRFECGVALKKIERGDDVFGEEILVVFAEEHDRVRLHGADSRRCRQRARLRKRVADAGEVEEPILAEKWQIAFDQILVVRIERCAILADRTRFRFLGELVWRRHDPPPIGHLLIAVGMRNLRRAVSRDDRLDHRLPLNVALNLHAQKLRRARAARGRGDGPGAGLHGRRPDQRPMTGCLGGGLSVSRLLDRQRDDCARQRRSRDQERNALGVQRPIIINRDARGLRKRGRRDQHRDDEASDYEQDFPPHSVTPSGLRGNLNIGRRAPFIFS